MLSKLDKMFQMRIEFLAHLRKTREPDLPVEPLDITLKQSQQLVRSLILKGVEEMFEALVHFKNWKTHKLTENKEFDKEAFLEEMVDAFNYFLSACTMLGISSDEFFDAFVKKDRIIHERLENGY